MATIATDGRSEEAKSLKGFDDGRPSVAELHGGHKFAQLAKAHWQGGYKPGRTGPDFVKAELWDALEEDGFQSRSLLVLENLQLLENLLWPAYTEDVSDHHVLLIVFMLNTKVKEGLLTWDIFKDNPFNFSLLFRRILSMTLDYSLALNLRSQILICITTAFRSLDSAVVRKECAPLVSISIWHNLHSQVSREHILEGSPYLHKAWRSASKRYEAADEATKARLRFERLWLCSLIIDFLKRIYNFESNSSEEVVYCEWFLEFLVDLESQLPTRRYVNTLIYDLNVLPLLRLSAIFNDEDNALIRDLYNLLRHYASFSVDDATGVQLSRTESYEKQSNKIAALQRIALRHFKDKLTILALSNLGSAEKRADLEAHLDTLTDEELVHFCSLLNLRTEYPKSSSIIVTRRILIELIVSAHEKRTSFQETVQQLSILPTESTLYEPTLLRNELYNGSSPLAIPKLNLQYLSTGDFLWRSFILHRLETFFEIRKDVEAILKRLQARTVSAGNVHFDGFSKMALPIVKPAIIEAAQPLVGEVAPAYVLAEVTLEFNRLADSVRREWESLRQNDVIFLLAVDSPVNSKTNGVSTSNAARAVGLKHLRTAEVAQVLDENGRNLRDTQTTNADEQGYYQRSRGRKLLVKIDPKAYKLDMDRIADGKSNVYESINVLARRKGRENNFKPILESIRNLTLSELPIPEWLRNVFLGFGDPAGASYSHLANRLQSLDFRDTFLEWNHLVQSFPGKVVEPSEDVDSSFPPPYVLRFSEEQTAEVPPSKKRRRDQADTIAASNAISKIQVSTYDPPNNGPYPTDALKLNSVRFTPAQVEAIISGTQPGLTVIVGPPGTGKTDVAVQIINNLYHDFPTQKTLLVTHSNQALNQLFQKIVALDIDERHLLRLGHGEEELETAANYSKHGRVESFLENRARYLYEVDQLAKSLEAPGAHGDSCETAGYFDSVYVKPAWRQFERSAQSADITRDEIVETFPFQQYFSNAPQPLFPPDGPVKDILEIANGCYRHIRKIFAELADIRPFELLRNQRDRSNYLLVKEARIIAMTSTHAAMRRQEIASLGFHYQNLIMEEAAQVTEIETFIPMALQNVKDGQLPLERVVFCGDHKQNSPIISNLAFRKFANLEQSLFLRFVRLNVPVINLDQQGRARPSIAELYSWRYSSLGNLSLVEIAPEFQTANAGLAHDYQFIDVQDYKGVGESEPTPHWIQNLGEAEYAVALYQYMRLLGYPASKISILTPYAGQRSLIRDVLSHRCAKNRLFGLPRAVSTVDRYQGEQNDYIILSLTRTSRLGYLRDIRRMTVALSRARLGLYIFGRRTVFESCFELREAFQRLFKRPDTLQLVIGELYPTKRLVSSEVDATAMEGVEHLGQYVFEMTQAKVAALKGENGETAPKALGAVPEILDDDMADEDGAEEE